MATIFWFYSQNWFSSRLVAEAKARAVAIEQTDPVFAIVVLMCSRLAKGVEPQQHRVVHWRLCRARTRVRRVRLSVCACVCVALVRLCVRAFVSSRDTSAIWCRRAAAALCRQVAIVAHDTTPCPDKNVRLLFFNVSVRNQPIFITFGAHIWQKHTNIFCNFAYLKIHLACVLTLGYRKATEIWPDA